LARYGEGLTIEQRNIIPWKAGDVISITADMEESIVKFFVNGAIVLKLTGLHLHPVEQFREGFRFAVAMKISPALLRSKAQFESELFIIKDHVPFLEEE
jgi:hypothetical protein